MSQRLVLSLAILLACCTIAAAEKPQNWLEVRSPHFVVVTNANEKNGRHIADQFERMRSVFHVAFPKMQIDPSAPIVVLAIRDEKDFRALEPEAYLAKGSLKLGGLFLRGPEKNYVLMRIDADGDHPYSVIYHEYTHLLTSKAEWMPLWMNEGLAEFYQNTDIMDKYAAMGQVSADNLIWLRQNRLLPLPTLFAVDHNSPYYHEENKGSIFYAESWALMHYLEVNDFRHKTDHITEYASSLAQNVDPVTAAGKAFGDLKKLQSELERYIQNGNYSYFKLTTKTEVDDSAFAVQPLALSQADAIRADFLAYNQRYSDADALDNRVLQDDPKNVQAHETKGFLEFRQGHIAEAKNWYKQAVELDSKSYLACYYYGAMAMSSSSSGEEDQAIENSLRTATKLNPQFAPAFDRLAVFLGMHRKDLSDARMQELTAVSLEPTNVGYRINMANIYLAMEQGTNAVTVLRTAAKVAKKPEESQMIDNALMHAQEYAEAQARYAAQKEKMQADNLASSTTTESDDSTGNDNVPKLKHREFVGRGPHRFLSGTLKGIHCGTTTLDLTVNANGKIVAMHADNYYKLPFTALGFEPSAELHPCKDLENRPAKVEYVESADPAGAAQLISVELHK